jgi:hypothetical protein
VKALVLGSCVVEHQLILRMSHKETGKKYHSCSQPAFLSEDVTAELMSGIRILFLAMSRRNLADIPFFRFRILLIPATGGTQRGGVLAAPRANLPNSTLNEFSLGHSTSESSLQKTLLILTNLVSVLDNIRTLLFVSQIIAQSKASGF